MFGKAFPLTVSILLALSSLCLFSQEVTVGQEVTAGQTGISHAYGAFPELNSTPQDPSNSSQYSTLSMVVCGACAAVLLLATVIIIIIIIVLVTRRKKAPEQYAQAQGSYAPQRPPRQKPTSGKCSKCNGMDMRFYDNGQGVCLRCGREFTWGGPQPAQQQYAPPPRKKGYSAPAICAGVAVVIVALLILAALLGAGLFLVRQDATEDGYGPLRIDSLSTTSATPGALLTVSGAGLSSYDDLFVRFTYPSGLTIDVPTVSVSDTAAVAGVPPVIDGATGDISSGNVGVQVLKGWGNGAEVSNSLEGLQVSDLPACAQPAGKLAEGFMNATIRLARENLAGLGNNSLKDPKMVSSIESQIRTLEGLASDIRSLAQNKTTEFEIGKMDGSAIKVDKRSLAAAEAMLLGMVAEHARGGQPAARGPSSRNDASDLGPYASNYIYEAQKPNGNPNSDEYINRLASAVPNAFNTAFMVVGGTGAVAISILALSGMIPAMALALPAAALMYVTMVGGMGEIGLGATLANQGVPGAVDMIKNGIGRIEGCMQSFARDALVPKLATAGAIFDMWSGAKDLSNAFMGGTEKPPVNKEITYEGTFDGTAVMSESANCPECGIVGCQITYDVSGSLSAIAKVDKGGAVTGTMTITGRWTTYGAADCSHVAIQENTGPISGSQALSGTLSDISGDTSGGMVGGASGRMTSYSISGTLEFQTTSGGSFEVPYTIYAT